MKGGIAFRFALLMSLVALVATGTVGFMVYRGAKQSLMEAASDELSHTAEVIRVRLATNVEAIEKDLQFLSATPPVQGLVRARMTRGFDRRLAMHDEEWGEQLAETFKYFLESRPSYLQARFIGTSEHGRELVRVEKRGPRAYFAPVEELQASVEAPFLDEVVERVAGSVYLSDIRPNREPGMPEGIPILHAATPVYSESGDVYGVLVVSVDYRQFLGTLEALVDSTKTLYVASGGGELLLVSGRAAAPPATEAAAPLAVEAAAPRLQEIFPSAVRIVNGARRELRHDDIPLQSGERGLAYLGRLPLGRRAHAPSVLIGVTEPHESILAGVRAVRNQSAIITLLFGLGAVILALTVSTYLTRPLRQITKAVSGFGQGQTVPLPVERGDEIGVLARSFDAMVTQIQKQIEELGEEERRQRTILETSAEGIIVADAEGRIETFNSAAEQIFGYRAEQVCGRPVGSLLEMPRREAAGGNGHWMHFLPKDEAVGVRADGSRVPLAVTWSGFTLGDEERYTIFFQDVSERKEAEAARERLVEELERERASLQRLSETLEERVRQRTEDLVRANKELERSNRELRDFADVASHDLQEPLRKLRSFADLLVNEHGDRLDDTGRLYLERIAHAAERMSQLILDLLAFSHVNAREQMLRRVDLHRVAHEVLDDLEMQAAEAGATVHVGPLPTIEADPVQMRQLLQNLIANAIKFHRPGVPPVVHLRAVDEDDNPEEDESAVVRIEITDNGMGFDEKYAEKIFSPFQRLHDGRTHDGTGMGLTICRRIVEHHGGGIVVRSRPGQGTTFLITLPVSQHRPA